MFWTLSIDIISLFQTITPTKDSWGGVIALMDMSSFFVISACYRGLFTICGSRPRDTC